MTEMTTGDAAHPLRREVVLLLQLAMVVFVWTVAIGILNGTDLVDFSRKVLLSHVHAGTLGWITTSVFAATLWLFGETATPGQIRTARWLARAAMVTLPLFAFTLRVHLRRPAGDPRHLRPGHDRRLLRVDRRPGPAPRAHDRPSRLPRRRRDVRRRRRARRAPRHRGGHRPRRRAQRRRGRSPRHDGRRLPHPGGDGARGVGPQRRRGAPGRAPRAGPDRPPLPRWCAPHDRVAGGRRPAASPRRAHRAGRRRHLRHPVGPRCPSSELDDAGHPAATRRPRGWPSWATSSSSTTSRPRTKATSTSSRSTSSWRSIT